MSAGGSPLYPRFMQAEHVDGARLDKAAKVHILFPVRHS